MNSPPPKPSYTTSIKLDNMSKFNSKSGPCFHGDSEVLMADLTTKRVSEIKKGDLVYCPNTKSSTVVRCVIETPLADGMVSLVHLPKGLKVTPWHPVRINGKWVFPSSLQPAIESPCPSLFSFLLNDGHSMQINGVECVTVAHHF